MVVLEAPDEASRVEALAARHIAGTDIDVIAKEPLAASSRLWGWRTCSPFIWQARLAVTKTM